MMRRRELGPRGSVTVVLTLVLVPIMVVAGLFVDGSRGVLARSVVRSAQQLAINDVLAKHDDLLRQTFGLLAVIDSEELDVAARQILASSASGDGGGDVLRLKFSSEDFGEVEVVANANLAQADVLTNQIVEYMKYRAPVEFMSQLAESINWLINLQTKIELVKKRVEGINKLAKLVDEVNDLADQVAEMADQLTAAYDALTKLNTLLADDGPDSIKQRFLDLARAYLDYEAYPSAASRRAFDQAQTRALEIWTIIEDAATKAGAAATALMKLDPTGVVTAASDLIDFVDKDLLPAAKKDEEVSAGADSDGKDAQEDAGFLKTTAQKVKDAILNRFSERDRAELSNALDRFAKDAKPILAEKYTKAKLVSMLSSTVGDAIDAYKEAKDAGEEPGDAALLSILEGTWDNIWTLVYQDLNGPLRELTDAMLFSKLKDLAEKGLKELGEDLVDAVKRGISAEVSEQATVSVQAMIKSLKDRAVSYGELLDAVATQKATPYEGTDRWDNRPSLGGASGSEEATEELAAFADADETDLDAFSADSTSLLDSVLGLVDGLLQKAEDVRDGVFFTEYVTGMFTYSTLDNVSVTMEQSKNQNCLWSAKCAAQKKESADKKAADVEKDPKKRTPEGGATSDGDPGKRISQEDYPDMCWEGDCASEVEYVLTGLNSPAAVYGMISLLRYGINLVVAFSDRIVTAIRMVVAGIPFVGWLAAAVPFVAALIQTFDDMARMRNGELVTFIPKELSVLRFGAELSKEALSIGEVQQSYNSTQEKRTSGKRRQLGEVELGYIHYLKIFLIIGWIADSEGQVRRAGDIIDFNMGYLGRDDFHLEKAGTAFTVSSQYEVQPFVATFFGGSGPADSLFEGDSGKFRLTTVGGF